MVWFTTESPTAVFTELSAASMSPQGRLAASSAAASSTLPPPVALSATTHPAGCSHGLICRGDDCCVHPAASSTAAGVALYPPCRPSTATFPPRADVRSEETIATGRAPSSSLLISNDPVRGGGSPLLLSVILHGAIPPWPCARGNDPRDCPATLSSAAGGALLSPSLVHSDVVLGLVSLLVLRLYPV